MKLFGLMILLAGTLAVASSMAQSTKAKDTMMTHEELCSLIAIECEGEAPVEIEIYEVSEYRQDITPAEVAMWYTESNVKLLDTVMNSGNLEALESLLAEQHAYARAVMIATES